MKQNNIEWNTRSWSYIEFNSVLVFLSVVPDDSAGPVDVTESVPLTAEALEKLFWQQFQTTATQTSRSQTPENTCLDGETQTEITYDVTSLNV